MHIVIATVGEVFFEGEAKSLTVPASEGEMTVLGEHMPLVTTLTEGVIVLRESHEIADKEFHIKNGVLEVRRDGVTVVL